VITDMWEYVPKWQQNTIDRRTKGNQRWRDVIVSLEQLYAIGRVSDTGRSTTLPLTLPALRPRLCRYGPRCNATERCDELRGVCLNVSSLPIDGYDQNGTCRCHPFFTGRNCDRPITAGDACLGIVGRDMRSGIEPGIGDPMTTCAMVRDKLFLCGDPQAEGALRTGKAHGPASAPRSSLTALLSPRDRRRTSCRPTAGNGGSR